MDTIKNELREGEKLLWCGSPEEFETMDKTNKAAIIRKAVILCVSIFAFCAFYIIYALTKGIEIKIALVIVAVICALLGSFNFYFNAKKIRKAVYAITDQRIFTVIDVPKSVEFVSIKDIQLKTDSDGHSSVLCGKKTIESKANQWRSIALLDPYIDRETGVCERYVLYAIPDAEYVKKILSDFLPV